MNLATLKLNLPLFLILFSQEIIAVNFQFPQTNSNGVSDSKPEQSTVRDPFTPSRLMYEIVSSQSGLSSNTYGFIPNLQGINIPKMILRGYVDKENESPLALLEIEGSGTYMVREGDEINIDPSQPRQAIRISKITRLSVTVEAGTLGSIRILR